MDPDERPPSIGPAVSRWNQQAWPPLTFGVPAGWTDVDAAELHPLPVEGRLPPDAPVIQRSRVLAGVRIDGAHGPWEVQLREFDTPAMASYVAADPARWAEGRAAIGPLAAEPEVVDLAGRRLVLLTYRSSAADVDTLFCEVWPVGGEGAWWFAATGPAADGAEWSLALRTMLGNLREAPSPVVPPALPALQPVVASPAAPVIRFRCPVGSQLPVTLENVTTTRPRMFVIGSPSFVAWSTLGIAAASLYGHARAGALEGSTVDVPATGEAVLLDDRLRLHLVVAPTAGRVALRADEAARTVELDIPYGVVRSVRPGPAGVTLDVVGRGEVRLRSHDDAVLHQWLAHLSHGRTWQPPRRLHLPTPTDVPDWCRQDPRYTFGLPSGWIHAHGPAVDGLAAELRPAVLRCAVVLDAGQHEPQVLVIELGAAHELVRTPDEEGLGATLREGLGGDAPLESVVLDGEPAVLLRAVTPQAGGWADRQFGAVAHAGVLYALSYGTDGGWPGDGSYERWLPEFHAMLATWHWYG